MEKIKNKNIKELPVLGKHHTFFGHEVAAFIAQRNVYITNCIEKEEAAGRFICRLLLLMPLQADPDRMLL